MEHNESVGDEDRAKAGSEIERRHTLREEYARNFRRWEVAHLSEQEIEDIGLAYRKRKARRKLAAMITIWRSSCKRMKKKRSQQTTLEQFLVVRMTTVASVGLDSAILAPQSSTSTVVDLDPSCGQVLSASSPMSSTMQVIPSSCSSLEGPPVVPTLPSLSPTLGSKKRRISKKHSRKKKERRKDETCGDIRKFLAPPLVQLSIVDLEVNDYICDTINNNNK